MSTPGATLQLAVLLAVLVLALVLAVLLRSATGTGRRRRGNARPAPAAPPADDAGRALPAVIANPTKILDIDGERAWLCLRCTELGWRRPLWLETTADEPGTAAARTAVARGAGTVVAYGGDGTVRAVAAGLEGSDTSLAILPMGTGNLLARNLGIPLSDHERAVEVALTGPRRRIDLGEVEVDVSGEDQDPVRGVFLVMAGLGFDAEVMANVGPQLKQRVGWLAYVLAGARRLRGRTIPVMLRLDDAEPIRRRVRSVVIGNCGELTGGVQLLPDAVVDDGWLDVVVVAPRRMLEWAAVVVSVLSRTRIPGRRGRPDPPSRSDHPSPARTGGNTVVEYFRCRELEVRAERPLPVQLDGDPAGQVRVLRARVIPLGLAVQVPS